MKVLDKNDNDILKLFLRLKEASYIRTLNLDYDNDYYYGLIMQALQGEKNLNSNIDDWKYDIDYKIRKELEKNKVFDDEIYYYFEKLIIKVLKKYYNDDGTLK